ncbi:hypothetical protein Hanom_Chr09g00791281 [Helianthus anomalus]
MNSQPPHLHPPPSVKSPELQRHRRTRANRRCHLSQLTNSGYHIHR